MSDNNTNTARLKELKKNIEQSYSYFKANNDRYHEFVKFVFNTSMTNEDIQTLRDLGKPTLEFNILESFVSRQSEEMLALNLSWSLMLIPFASQNSHLSRPLPVKYEDHN